MKFQNNIYFGPFTEELKLEVYNSLEKIIFYVIPNLKETLQSKYRKKNSEKFLFFDQESSSGKTISQKRREAFMKVKEGIMPNFPEKKY